MAAPATRPGDIRGFADRLKARLWTDWDVAALCIAHSLVEFLTEENLRHPLLARWRRAYRAFVAAAVEGRGIDFAASRERVRLKDLTEQIRLAFHYAARHPHAKKKAGARQRSA